MRRLMAVGFVAFLSSFLWEPMALAQTQPPNIVIFLSDDAPFGSLSKAAMPNVWNRLVEKGVRFTRFYVENPLCCPSRATILTGLGSASTGVYSNADGGDGGPWWWYGGTKAFHEYGNETRTIAYELQQYGYATGLFGKYLNQYPFYAGTVMPDAPETWRPLGWDAWTVFYEPNGVYYDYRLNENGILSYHGSSAQDHSTTLLGQKAVEWLRTVPVDTPFFLLYAPYAPHAPSTPDPRDVGRFSGSAFSSPAVNEDRSDKPTYLRSVRARQMSPENYAAKLESLYSMDRQVGAVIDAIRDRGQSSNTIFVYLSDNGLGWGEHGWTYKLVPYERSIRVPAAIRYDAVVPAGSVDSGLASNIDLKRTIFSLAGLRLLNPTDGVDVVNRDRRKVFILNMYRPRPEKGSVPSYCGVVTEKWKYVIYAPNEYEPSLVNEPYEHELYNLYRDPYELDNLIYVRPNSDLVRKKVLFLRSILKSHCSLPDVGASWFESW